MSQEIYLHWSLVHNISIYCWHENIAKKLFAIFCHIICFSIIGSKTQCVYSLGNISDCVFFPSPFFYVVIYRNVKKSILFGKIIFSDFHHFTTSYTWNEYTYLYWKVAVAAGNTNKCQTYETYMIMSLNENCALLHFSIPTERTCFIVFYRLLHCCVVSIK